MPVSTTERFETITINPKQNQERNDALIDALLANYRLAPKIEFTQYIGYNKYRVGLTDSDSEFPIFRVTDSDQLKNAVSVFLKFQLTDAYIVADNRSGFINREHPCSLVHEYYFTSGEILSSNQGKKFVSKSCVFFDGKLCIYKLTKDNFDDTEDVNEFNFNLNEKASEIRKKCGNDKRAMVYEVLHWFRDNVTYDLNGTREIYSAICLAKTGVGVCKAFSLYAYKLLTLCGIDTRFVSGEGNGQGGWGPHAWNMVKIDGEWIHVDFTFQRKRPDRELFKTPDQFRKNHRWDEELYSPANSDEIIRTKNNFDSKEITAGLNTTNMYIGQMMFNINLGYNFCISHNNLVYISFFDLLRLFGACYRISGNTLHVYIDGKKHSVDVNVLRVIRGIKYISIANLPAIGCKFTLSLNRVFTISHN